MPLYVVTATRLARQFTQATIEIEADSADIARSMAEDMESDGSLDFKAIGPADNSDVEYDAAEVEESPHA